MKQALLITAYKNLSYLSRLADTFDPDFRLYIHIDKKTAVTKEEICRFRQHPSIRFADQIHEVKWGGMRHVDSILYLCEQAFADPDNQYFHLISGSDFLTKNLRLFKHFFSAHRNENFMEYFPLPSPYWSEEGLNRLEWYHPLDRIDIHTPDGWKLYRRYLERQKNSGRKRSLPSIPLYGGSSWWSLSRACIAYILENKNRHSLYDRMQDTFAPDELYFQTLILNSPFAATVRNENLRYICWEMRNGNIPATLDYTDIIPILLSDSFFARKADPEISEELLKAFDTIRSRNRHLLSLRKKNDRERLETIVGILCREVRIWPLPGLLCGRLGICLFLFHYGRASGIAGYSKKAYEGLYTLIREAKTTTDRSYSHGTMGIATGIEYLRNQNFIHADTDKFLLQVDRFTRITWQQLATGQLAPDWMTFYHFDLYINERRRNQPAFEEWPFFEPRPEAVAQVRKNRRLLARQFEHPEEIACPGIIGLAGWGWHLLRRIYPDYPLDDTLFSDYFPPDETSD